MYKMKARVNLNSSCISFLDKLFIKLMKIEKKCAKILKTNLVLIFNLGRAFTDCVHSTLGYT